jgi:peptidoglycan/LPS O-acetylase OafA/YrhL
LVAACFGHHNYYFTFFHCDGLAFGAYLACTFAQRHTNQPRRTGRSLTILALSCVALFFTARPLASSHSLVINSFAAAMLQTGVVFLSIVIVAFLLDHSGSKILCFLRTGFFPFFGTISYALYMIHLYVMQAYDHLRGPLTNDDLPAYLIRFFTIAAVTVTLCLLSRYLIELPAASLRRYVLKPAKRIVNDRRP